MGFPGGPVVKNLPANARNAGLSPGTRRSPGEGNGTPVFLPGTSHGQRSLVVAVSQTQLSDQAHIILYSYTVS